MIEIPNKLKDAIYSIEMGKNIYLGETTNVSTRWKEHRIEQDRAFKLIDFKERPLFNILAELPCGLTQSKRRKIENEWIKHFKQFKNIVNNLNSCTAEVRDKMSKRRKGKFTGKNNPTYKGEKITLIHKDTGELIDMEGITNVAKQINTSTSNLRGLIDGKHKTIKGFRVVK